MRILVTGGAGFIGSHLVERLLREDHNVIVLDDLSSGRIENLNLKNHKLSFFQGDVCDKKIVKKVLKNVEVVFHLAALIDVSFSVENPAVVNHVNVCGALNVLEESVKGGVEKFIFASSCAVYGDPQHLPIDEEHPTDPISPYAVSKLAVEKYCRAFSKLYGLKTVSLRLFNVYGPRQEGKAYSGVITQMIQRLKSGKPPIIFGDGTQTRDFVYVLDVVDAFYKAMNVKECAGEINIGSGEETSIKELAKLLMEKFGLEVEPVYMEPKTGEIKRSWANIEKAKRVLGYVPKFTLSKGLDALLNFYRRY
ncbi:MAG: SDR family oxidoreductase [Candidatus Bathyarchaeota archaeon]|nr:SDR family oxidoreductase [Candidatus Bathyarchaeota archaeon]MDW8040700.1 SDR family oxidoreductase [Nitrososphaerota archaeon]